MLSDPKLSQNSDCYAARAIEERRLAMAAKDPNARAAHLELAEKYGVLAQSGAPEPPQVIGEHQQAG